MNDLINETVDKIMRDYPEQDKIYIHVSELIPAADVRESQGWISVKDKMPRKDCIVYEANSKRVLFAYLEEIDAADWNVTHWMPLPEPPKGE